MISSFQGHKWELHLQAACRSPPLHYPSHRLWPFLRYENIREGSEWTRRNHLRTHYIRASQCRWETFMWLAKSYFQQITAQVWYFPELSHFTHPNPSKCTKGMSLHLFVNHNQNTVVNWCFGILILLKKVIEHLTILKAFPKSFSSWYPGYLYPRCTIDIVKYKETCDADTWEAQTVVESSMKLFCTD